ncbi:endolytic transglycosylase MltG [Promicromonospora sp. NPDC057138]|uniref:endolytic transglycosylase MltG n=1 Tax=Promicromonospora sp. NPDC057138 TaxID=3346031 RepID=UPI0036362565
MYASRRDRRTKKSRRPLVIALVAVLVVVGGLGAWTMKNDGYLFGIRTPLAAADYEGTGGQDVEVEVPENANGYAIGVELAQKDVVASAEAFVHAFNADPDAGGIQAGTHVLKLRMSAASAVALLAENKINRGGFTVPEGLTAEQIKQRMIKQGWPEADVKAAFDNIGKLLPPQAGGKPEGWLFPSTYDVKPKETPATDVLKEMIAQTVSVLGEVNVPLDQRESILAMASLIEREAKNPEDQPKMSRVIHSRIEQNWYLGIDASILYGVGRTSGALYQSELDDASNPYNLRRHKGLPPTAISNPGRSAIDAAMNPADGTWMYWCAVNLETGETKFATTQEEFDALVAELRAWEAANGH